MYDNFTAIMTLAISFSCFKFMKLHSDACTLLVSQHVVCIKRKIDPCVT